MASVLLAAGFKNLESMQEFSNRFWNVSIFLDDDLEKIWVCHKNLSMIPKNEEINSTPSEDFQLTSEKILKRIAAGKDFYSLLTEFSAETIFNKISALFGQKLTTYLFTKCFLFYNWGMNAFEPLIDHFEIHGMIHKSRERTIRRIQRKVSLSYFNQQNLFKNVAAGTNKKAVSCRPGSSRHARPKQVSLNSVVKAVKGEEKFHNFLKNEKNPYQEKFNLNRILYDMKERSWAGYHILNKTLNDLIIFIMQVPIRIDVHIEKELIFMSEKWLLLRELLEKFIKNHGKLRENDGYRRILKKHLKNVKKPSDRGLQAIPKNNICSFIFDILRRALPLEIFGSNGIRKSFFSGLIKVINGSKGENFIWYLLLRRLHTDKFRPSWCAQLGPKFIQNLVILKLFKFLMIHYIFVILKNNFYITETGSSGFELRFFRKCDMESASSVFLRNLLEQGYLESVFSEEHTIERNWLDTGIIHESDLKRDLEISMSCETEYRQPTACVRFLPKSDFGADFRLITHITETLRKRSRTECCHKKLEKDFIVRMAKREKNLDFVKLFLHYLVDRRGFGILPLPCNKNLEAAWTKAKYLKEKHGKLYFVKADISDAFGSVDHDILAEQLRRAYEEEVKGGKVQPRRIIEWRMANSRVRKVARVSFDNRAAENSVVINRSSSLHSDKLINRLGDVKFLEIINQVVMQQRMKIKGRLFRLARGLALGSAGRFSTHLCEIYYSSMDNTHFGSFLNSTDCILVRAVDDYLFITSDPDKCKKFLEMVQNGIPGYNIRFSSRKLKSNLMEDIKEVSYLGLVFNFDEMFAKPNYSKYQQNDLQANVNLNDKSEAVHFSKELFLKRRSLLLKCLKLHPIVVGRTPHSLKLVRQTLFEACLMQSLRVLTLADYLFSGRVKNDSAVYRTLVLSCSRIKKMVASCKISPEEANWLFFFSVLNVLHKYSGQFKILPLMIRYRLQKFEKAFTDNGTELFLNLLKSDILDEHYWKGVRSRFKELNQRPLKV